MKTESPKLMMEKNQHLTPNDLIYMVWNQMLVHFLPVFSSFTKSAPGVMEELNYRGYVFVYKCCKYLKYIYFLQNLFSHVTNKTSLWVLRAIFCSCNSYKPRVQWTNVFTQGLLSFVLSFLYKFPVYCKGFVSATHRLSVWTKKGTLLSCHA